VALFRKSAEPSSSPAQLPVLYEPPVKPSAAPKAGDLEREIRREIWQHMSPALAASAGLSLSDLLDWTTGVLRLSPLQIEAIARKMGILDTPVSGLAVIRQAMERLTNGKFPSWGAAGNRRRRLDTLGEEDSLSMQHHAAVHAFIAGDDSALTLPEINEFVAHWCLTDKPITIRGPMSFAGKTRPPSCAPRSRRPLNAVRSRRLSDATRSGTACVGVPSAGLRLFMIHCRLSQRRVLRRDGRLKGCHKES
jgi:hypothetical protein